MMSLAPEPLHRGQKLNWNHPVALIGDKVSDPAMHFCEKCELPILVYGRMLPCKHIFCYDCALQADRKCTRCTDPVTRVERCELGQIHMCTFGAPKHSYKACRRTYLSQRDLQAHVNHRHSTKSGSSTGTSTTGASIPSTGPPPSAAAVIRPSAAQRQASHRHHHQVQQSQQASAGVGISNATSSIPVHRPPPTATTTSRANLITIQLQGDQSATTHQGARRINQRQI